MLNLVQKKELLTTDRKPMSVNCCQLNMQDQSLSVRDDRKNKQKNHVVLYIRHTIFYCMWFVPKVSVLIFLCTNWQRSTSLMYIGTWVVTFAACPYLFQLDLLSQSCATAVHVWSCFLTSLRLRCKKISNNGTLSNFV